MNPNAPVPVTLAQLMIWGQLILTVLSIMGFAFALGRVFERLTFMQKDLGEIKLALFGGEKQEGIFVRRTELGLMHEHAESERKAMGRSVADLASRVGALEGRGGLS